MDDHFKLEEFTCHDGTPYPDEWLRTRFPALHGLLEAIRHVLGDHPVHVLCGYRTFAYNQFLRDRGLHGERHETGVAEHSQHREGRAADIAIFGVDTRVLYSAIIEAHEAGKLHDLGGVGCYAKLGFVHVDTYKLATGQLRTWQG